MLGFVILWLLGVPLSILLLSALLVLIFSGIKWIFLFVIGCLASLGKVISAIIFIIVIALLISFFF